MWQHSGQRKPRRCSWESGRFWCKWASRNIFPGSLLNFAPVSRLNTSCVGLVQDAENAGKATKEPVGELICTSRLHRYNLHSIVGILRLMTSFAALLHLCNEQNLALESTGDEFKDFTISRPSWKVQRFQSSALAHFYTNNVCHFTWLQYDLLIVGTFCEYHSLSSFPRL